MCLNLSAKGEATYYLFNYERSAHSILYATEQLQGCHDLGRLLSSFLWPTQSQ